MFAAAFPALRPGTMLVQGFTLARRRMPPVDADIELWLIDLTQCAPVLEALEQDIPRLAETDRERAGVIRDAGARRQRMAAYVALRVLLERAVGTGIRRQPLLHGAGGKPGLAGGEAQFSLSHIEGFALIGVAAANPIGVDLERTRPLKLPPRRREELCAAGAGLAGKRLPGTGTDRATIQAWVRLEAFTKARGRALARTLADLGLRGKARRPLPLADLETAARRLARRAGFDVFDLELPPGLQAAVAVPVGVGLPGLRLFPAHRAGAEQLLAAP